MRHKLLQWFVAEQIEEAQAKNLKIRSTIGDKEVYTYLTETFNNQM
jgi:ferritin